VALQYAKTGEVRKLKLKILKLTNLTADPCKDQDAAVLNV
jgi:hypothetical protein